MHVVHRTNILTGKALVAIREVKARLEADMAEFQRRLKKLSEFDFNAVMLEWQAKEGDV